jgi:hypothetical protein
MKATYDGQFAELEVARAGQSWLVKRGETVDLPDDVALGLVDQDGWTVKITKTTGRKATTEKDDQ